MRYTKLAAAAVPQSEPLDPRQVVNNAGGFVFEIDDWARLDRFLILGSDSQRGRAPRNDAAVFALAMGAAHKDEAVRRGALAALPLVCRTSTHLFQFVNMARTLGRGWGRTLKRAVAEWYDARPVDDLAYQAIKYREREGYTHKRLLQTAHPKGGVKSEDRAALYRWMCGKEQDVATLPGMVGGHLAAMQASGDALAALIGQHRLPWEAIPTEAKKDATVWLAMLPHLGMTALLRNLGAMTACGALTPLSDAAGLVGRRLTDVGELKRARIHPFSVLQALVVYRSGRGVRGALTWLPVGEIVAAIERAFYLAFEAVEPTGKRYLIGIDVSGSMGTPFADSPLTVREAAAAMAMTTVRTEPACHVVGFTSAGGRFALTGLTALPIHAGSTLNEAVAITSSLPFGATDCALPMRHAIDDGLDVDVFVVLTDNETWHVSEHPAAALRRYRQSRGRPAKLIVAAMTSTGFSIADPDDAGMLDVVGFDASAPGVMAEFARS